MIQHAKQKQPSDSIKQLAERFLCPITQEIMQDPVVTADGFTYERSAITAWIETRGARAISPVTGEHLAHHELVANTTLRSIIQEYLALQPTLKQKKLTEQNIQTAIQIRDEEIRAMLEKREGQVASVQAEPDSVFRQLEPMERKIAHYLEKQLPSSPEPKFFAKQPEAKPIQPPVDPGQIEQLLKHIIRSEQDEAEAMLKATPALACAAGNITDLSKRTFAGITALQYAVWAWDWHMWTMIMKYLPTAAAREQCLVFQNHNASWMQQHGKHFDLNPIIQALQTYVSGYSGWDNDKRRDYWCKTVGGLQRQLPAHVINEYCRPDRSFDPTPNFREPTLPRRGYGSGSREFGLDCWFSADNYGIYRGSNRLQGITDLKAGLTVSSVAGLDGMALRSLLVTREQQVEKLLASLDLTTRAGSVPSCK